MALAPKNMGKNALAPPQFHVGALLVSRSGGRLPHMLALLLINQEQGESLFSWDRAARETLAVYTRMV